MEGKILGNRYELIEKIGGGGMALVYKARCRLLNRFVAVKILRPEFTNDEEFVKRFKIEAQSAASLSHPNIVSIYDVGNDENIYYIIMEYIDGITLKEYIDSKEILPWREAVNVGIQICSAIEHAHRNHIVHRDIKPHNILITKEGIAKVTDFGIARAVSSSTITMVGSTIGSVHYFSPEQARGGFVDEKSDLYSLGITIYEMVTGTLPFNGETPIAVALKHIQQDPPAPIEINKNMPKGINDIILKAIRKEQNKRYQSAPELLDDMNKVLKDPSGSFILQESTDESPTRRMNAITDDRSISREEYLIKENPTAKKMKKGDRLTKWLAIITAVVVMVFLSVLVGLKIVMPIIPEKTHDFIVDNYVGKNIDEVKAVLAQSGLKDADIKVDEVYSKDSLAGTILDQSIEKGQAIKPGGFSPIEFKVSKGPKMIKIESYKNKDRREVEDEMATAGLVPDFITENSDTVPENKVIRTDPAVDEEVQENTTVRVYISAGPEVKLTKVPDLKGKTQQEALQLLDKAKLKVGKYIPDIGSDFSMKIVGQSPLPNEEVNEGSAVDIFFQTPEVKLQNITLNISLPASEQYGDTVKVRIESTPANSTAVTVLKEYVKNKADFDYSETLSLPSGTEVRVYLDEKLYLKSVVPMS